MPNRHERRRNAKLSGRTHVLRIETENDDMKQQVRVISEKHLHRMGNQNFVKDIINELRETGAKVQWVDDPAELATVINSTEEP